jgi:GntR family transcriptional repressor for pyruvate dehydrogenase complex
MQARAVVEGAVTLLAAPQITPEVLASLRRTVASMRAEIEQGRNPIEHDRQFHMLIAEQSGNHVLSRMVGDLFDERHSPISSQFRNRFETRETWRLAVAEHEVILGALEMRDALLAQAMMHTHLEQSKRRWLEGEPR